MFVLAHRLFWKNLSLKEEMLHKYSDFKLLSEKHKLCQPLARRASHNNAEYLTSLGGAYIVRLSVLLLLIVSPTLT